MDNGMNGNETPTDAYVDFDFLNIMKKIENKKSNINTMHQTNSD
jgi:hypothetical protein